MTAPASRRDFLAASAALLASPIVPRRASTKVVIWDERQPAQKAAYDDFLGNAIAAHLRSQPGLDVKSVGLDDPGQGVTDDVLGDARVLVWWGHVRQAEVKPEIGRKIVERIKAGTLSLVALHSAHWSTPFMEAMNEASRRDAERIDVVAMTGTRRPEIREVPPPQRQTLPRRDSRVTPYVEPRKFPDGKIRLDLHLPYCCFPAYRTDGKPSQVRVTASMHPIAAGLPPAFEIPQEEMYDEPFHVPEPDGVVFEERWPTGEWFRSGMVWSIGKGWVFYFRPGHETFPVYKQELPLKILSNAVRWLASSPEPE